MSDLTKKMLQRRSYRCFNMNYLAEDSDVLDRNKSSDGIMPSQHLIKENQGSSINKGGVVDSIDIMPTKRTKKENQNVPLN